MPCHGNTVTATGGSDWSLGAYCALASELPWPRGLVVQEYAMLLLWNVDLQAGRGV
jgi:hypothetical protein